MSDIVKKLWNKGFIVSADAAEVLKKIKVDVEKLFKELESSGSTVVTRQIIEKVINVKKPESQKVITQKSKVTTKGEGILKFFGQQEKVTIKIKKEVTVEVRKELLKKPTEEINVNRQVEIILPRKRHVGEELELSVDVIKNYKLSRHEITVNTWASYFRARLRHIKNLLKNHSELGFFVSFDNLKGGEDISVAGLVRDKRYSQKGIIFVLEDGKGLLKVFVSNDLENFEEINSVPLDSVIGVIGKYDEDRNMLFADQVFYPDIPYKNIKRGEDDIWIAFTGDFQIGNKKFLKKQFENFIKWLKGEYGSRKEREISRKLGYLVIAGDLVDGVGIYPNQQEELELITIEDQYAAMEKYFLEIPEHVQVIVIPGNHDAVRLAEPQPSIPEEFLPETYHLNNFYYLSNPCYVKLHNLLTVLVYHGYSMDWFVSEIPIIRDKGGYNKPAEIMKFMLMLRHLCPTHGSNPYLPYPDKDPLVIDPVPDVFVTGHIHRTDYAIYKGVELINASCFQDITQYQIELGHVPDPGKVILRNIKTGEVKILSFLN
jgi:DNA polymerase II small subunit